MGRPGARLGDKTGHGGNIVQVKYQDVLIGGLPAATILDAHVCPLADPGPHTGGPVNQGSKSVLIHGFPAARIGDLATCSGPTDVVSSGCMTVLIGGGGGAGGSGGGGGEPGSQDEQESEPVQVRFRLLAGDSAMRGASCRLRINDRETSLSPDGDGYIQMEVPTDAESGIMTIEQEDGSTVELAMTFGTLKPLSADSDDTWANKEAALQRLSMLGFLERSHSEHLEVALKDFQLYKGMEPTGELDSDTCDALNSYTEEAG